FLGRGQFLSGVIQRPSKIGNVRGTPPKVADLWTRGWYNRPSYWEKRRNRAVRRRAMSDVTSLLSAITQGDPHAAADLLPLVYDELRRVGARWLARGARAQTLEPTALVQEAYVRLPGTSGREADWDSRRHFFAAAAEAMRRILVEKARRKQRHRHGGGRQRVPLDEAEPAQRDDAAELLAIHEALDKLAAEDPEAAQLAQLRYFAGLSVDQAAEMIGLPRSTAYAHWSCAKASLRVLLGLDLDGLPS